MKVLIWIVSAFVVVLANELLGMMIGYKLGYVFVFLLISAVSTALTKAFLGEDAVKNKKSKGSASAPAMNQGPFPGGWTCSRCGTHQAADANFCDNCGNQKPVSAPVAAPAEMTRPQPTPAAQPMQSYPDFEMAQPENLPRQAPVQSAPPVPPVYQSVPQYQPVHNSYAPPHPSSQPVQQQTAAIRFYVSSLNTEVSVTRPSFTVGRDTSSDLSLARLPNAKYIARRQASFYFSGGKWYIQDENSTNGTFLNNRRIPGGQPQVLNTGDFISFAGKETLIVQELK